MSAGWAITHPAINRAILAQTATGLLHTSNLFFHDHTATLALKLTEITGMDRAFLCNSGTEAWEAAIKLARAHAELLRSEGRTIGTRMIALEHSFHGRTMGSVATTHKVKVPRALPAGDAWRAVCSLQRCGGVA